MKDNSKHEISESSCLCASVLKKDAGVVEDGFNTETQRRRGTEFKMTEIGLIPEDWEVKRLGDVLTIGNGKDYKHLNCGTIPVYGTGGLMTYVSEWLYDGATVCIGRKGTIDVPQYHEGKIWTVDTLYYTYGYKEVDIKFLYYLFLRIDWLSYNSATGVPSLTAKAIYDIAVALPPLHEQKAIAEALSDVDELLAAMTTLIEKKRAIKQGAMQELLTGKKRLVGFGNSESSCLCASVLKKDAGVVEDGFNTETQRRRGTEFKMTEIGLIPEDWECCKIGELAKICTGNRNTQDKNDNGRYPFYVRSPIVERIDEYGFNTEGVVTVGDGVGTGKVFHYVNGCFGLHQRCYLIDSFDLRLNSKYFYKVFSERFFDRVMQMTAKSSVDSVRREMITEMLIPLPPLPEQRAIAEVLSDMDAEIEALEAKRAKYESIKQSMMQELLTGKTRLKGV